MKKSLLLVAVMMAAVSSLSAQAVWVAGGAMFEKASEDGNYFVGSDGEGTLYIFDKQAGEYQFYNVSDDEVSEYYSVGFGNVFSSDNTMVGNINEFTPGILKNGEWTALPMNISDAQSGKSNSADAITADGKFICGGIAKAATMSIDAKDLMMAPVIWSKSNHGGYSSYTVLPHPDKDFTGRLPQYVTARGISDDGKTVVGMITDWSGFYVMPIVYRQNEAGEWSYEVIGKEYIYNTEVEFPAYPSYEPTQPEAEDYLSEEDLTRYVAAYQAYQDSVDHYFENYDSSWYPEYYPKAEDFLTGEGAETYNTLSATYAEEFALYRDSVDTFNEVFDDPEVVYNRSFEFNNVYVSRDGKYVASTLKWIEDDDDPESWYGYKEIYKPCRFDLTGESVTCQLADVEEGLCSSIMNDGSVLYVTPYLSYLRQTEVWPVGEEKGINLHTYIGYRHGLAAAEMEEALSFASVEDEENPVLYTGTACANGTGTLFYGWLADSWGELIGFEQFVLSYFVDMTAEDTIGPNALEQLEATTSLDGKKFLNGNFVISRQGRNFDLLGKEVR